eukprot:5725914-Amphidinium_carterae.1
MADVDRSPVASDPVALLLIFFTVPTIYLSFYVSCLAVDLKASSQDISKRFWVPVCVAFLSVWQGSTVSDDESVEFCVKAI